ncbi:uncharacterized protein LOC142975931 isoform X2 [Anticarsia gemmatalis]
MSMMVEEQQRTLCELTAANVSHATPSLQSPRLRQRACMTQARLGVVRCFFKFMKTDSSERLPILPQLLRRYVLSFWNEDLHRPTRTVERALSVCVAVCGRRL